MNIKKVKSGIVFACLLALAYLAVTNISGWEMNLFKFISVASSILYCIGILSPDDKVLKSYRDGDHLPRWLDCILYTLMICILASFAHYWLATCWLVIFSGDLNLRAQSEKPAKPKDTPSQDICNCDACKHGDGH